MSCGRSLLKEGKECWLGANKSLFLQVKTKCLSGEDSKLGLVPIPQKLLHASDARSTNAIEIGTETTCPSWQWLKGRGLGFNDLLRKAVTGPILTGTTKRLLGKLLDLTP